MTRQSPGRGFLSVRAFSGGPAAAPGRKKRRLPDRAVGVLAAVVLGLGVILPASLALGASPAVAATCGSSNPCAPTGVAFEQPGAGILVPDPSFFGFTKPLALSEIKVCGIGGEFSPLASADINSQFDDPNTINSPGFLGLPGNTGGTTEGNYPDSQLVAFQPATSLAPGDTITVGLPHPAEPYQNSGSVLPQAQIGLNTVLSNESAALASEQTSSQVSSTAPSGNQITVSVTLSSGGNLISGHTVRLDAFNPHDPPALGNGQPVQGSGNGIQGLTTTGYNGGDTAVTGATGPPGVATFQVTDSNNEDLVFAATDTTNNVEILQTTAPVTFGKGSPNTGVCNNSQLSAPAGAADSGFPYLLVENMGSSATPNWVGYLVPSAVVNTAPGAETATLTIPQDVPTVSTGQTAYLLALDATSPAGSAAAYPPDAFSVSTSEDPLPGYPSAVPTLQADASSSIPSYPVDGSTSTLTSSLTSSSPSEQVGPNGTLTATATLRDHYNNPVDGKQVSIFQCITSPCSATHANVTPSSPPTGGNEYPTTATPPPANNEGSVSYSVTDDCAETVNLEATDVTDNQPITITSGSALAQVPVTFTAGPPVAPDLATTPAGCGVPAVKSSVSVNGVVQVDGQQPSDAVTAPADGTTPTMVQVTLGDQFGNPDVCQQVVLAPTAKGSNTTITPQPPANPAPQGPACTNPGANGTTGTDGVATFKVTGSTVQEVTFDVTDTTSAATWPTNSTGNVAEINFVGLDTSGSTVTAASPTAPCTVGGNTYDACAPADGQPSATVTVTLKDSESPARPMQSQNVTLAGCTNNPTSPPSPCSPDASTTITPSSVATDNNGQAQFNVADSSPGDTVYYQATDASNGKIIAQVVAIRFTKGGESLSASPPTVVADGTGTSTVTFTLKDTSGNGLPGVPVSLKKPQNTGATIVPTPAATTDGSGTATFTVSDATAESVPFTATATYTPSSATPCLGMLSLGGTVCTVTGSVTVNFIAPPPAFCITPTPGSGVLADGVSSYQVTVAVVEGTVGGTCKNPIPIATAGIPVSLSATLATSPPTSSPTASISPSAGQPTNTSNQVVTDSSGQATFTVTDTKAETLTLSAGYQEIGQPSGSLTSVPENTPPATVTFARTEQEASTITASSPSGPCTLNTVNYDACAPADGSSAVTVTVKLQDGAGNSFGNHAVVLTTGSATTTVTPSPTTNVGGRTDSNGVVTFTVTDTRVETLTLYARDENTGALISYNAQGAIPGIAFTNTEAQNSMVTASPASVAAGGPLGAPRTSTVTVTLMGPIPSTCPVQTLAGHTVRLSSGSGTANIMPSPGVTNSGGVAQFTVSDPVVENVTLTAVDTTCHNLALAQTATVNFTASEANQSTVTISPVSTPADGPAATLTVTLRAANGTPISGHTVTVPAVLHATVTPLAYPGLPAGVTNAAGQAQFAVSDNTVEMVPLTASDYTGGGIQLDQGATVSFTANEANQSTMSATATSLPALGASTTVTVTLVSGGGAPIAGHTVSLSASSSTVSITPATATTNSAGQAVFTVSDPAVESAVLTALDTTTGATVVQTLPLTFTANEQNQSTATASPTFVQVKKTSTITVTLLGPTGQPLAGHAVALNTGSTTTKVTVLTAGGVTNAKGQIQFGVTDTAAQTISIKVTDTTVGVTLYKPVTVTFTKP